VKKLILSLALAIGAMTGAQAQQIVGKITWNDVGADMFVVVVDGGVAAHCPGGGGWAIVNATDPNYKAMVSALMMSRSSGSTVHLYTTWTAPHCRITYLSVH
jgi:hypothetical protein